MGIDRSVVIARIIGLVREYADYDSSDNAACDGRSTSSELRRVAHFLGLVDRGLSPSLSVWDFAPLPTNPVAWGFFVRISSEPPILQLLLGREKFARVNSTFEACTCCPSSARQHGYTRGVRRGEIK
jgi:hypothetical protein